MKSLSKSKNIFQVLHKDKEKKSVIKIQISKNITKNLKRIGQSLLRSFILDYFCTKIETHVDIILNYVRLIYVVRPTKDPSRSIMIPFVRKSNLLDVIFDIHDLFCRNVFFLSISDLSMM